MNRHFKLNPCKECGKPDRIKKALPNSTIGNDICGARIVRDRDGKDIGHISGEFYLYSGYEHGYEVYKRLLENGIYPVVIHAQDLQENEK